MVTDPNAERAYAEILQRGRERGAEIAEQIAGTRERVAEQVEQVRAQGAELTGRPGGTEDDQHNPWLNRRREPVTLAIGFEEPEPPLPGQQAPPRPAPEPDPTEDDDLSGRSWMR